MLRSTRLRPRRARGFSGARFFSDLKASSVRSPSLPMERLAGLRLYQKEPVYHFAICLRSKSGGAFAAILRAGETQLRLVAERRAHVGRFVCPAPLSCSRSTEEIDCWVLVNQRQELIPDHPPSRCLTALPQVTRRAGDTPGLVARRTVPQRALGLSPLPAGRCFRREGTFQAVCC